MPNPLEGAHPLIVQNIPIIIEEIKKQGYPMMIFEGRRSLAHQYELWCQGRSKPGKIVTNCDGTAKKSKHQQQPDGFHHAVDCVFLDKRGRVTWNGPWKIFGELVRASGLKWGGDFKKRMNDGKLVPNPDSPHVEVP